MTSAETVAHLHAARLWDLRVTIIVNAIMFAGILFLLVFRG